MGCGVSNPRNLYVPNSIEENTLRASLAHFPHVFAHSRRNGFRQGQMTQNNEVYIDPHELHRVALCSTSADKAMLTEQERLKGPISQSGRALIVTVIDDHDLVFEHHVLRSELEGIKNVLTEQAERKLTATGPTLSSTFYGQSASVMSWSTFMNALVESFEQKRVALHYKVQNATCITSEDVNDELVGVMVTIELDFPGLGRTDVRFQCERSARGVEEVVGAVSPSMKRVGSIRGGGTALMAQRELARRKQSTAANPSTSGLFEGKSNGSVDGDLSPVEAELPAALSPVKRLSRKMNGMVNQRVTVWESFLEPLFCKLAVQEDILKGEEKKVVELRRDSSSPIMEVKLLRQRVAELQMQLALRPPASPTMGMVKSPTGGSGVSGSGGAGVVVGDGVKGMTAGREGQTNGRRHRLKGPNRVRDRERDRDSNGQGDVENLANNGSDGTTSRRRSLSSHSNQSSNSSFSFAKPKERDSRSPQLTAAETSSPSPPPTIQLAPSTHANQQLNIPGLTVRGPTAITVAVPAGIHNGQTSFSQMIARSSLSEENDSLAEFGGNPSDSLHPSTSGIDGESLGGRGFSSTSLASQGAISSSSTGMGQGPAAGQFTKGGRKPQQTNAQRVPAASQMAAEVTVVGLVGIDASPPTQVSSGSSGHDTYSMPAVQSTSDEVGLPSPAEVEPGLKQFSFPSQ